MQARSTPSCPRVCIHATTRRRATAPPHRRAAAPPRRRAAAPPHRLVPGGEHRGDGQPPTRTEESTRCVCIYILVMSLYVVGNVFVSLFVCLDLCVVFSSCMGRILERVRHTGFTL